MRRKRAYREVLRSIDRLERELFPDWFKDEPVDRWSMAPGAVWEVDDPRSIMLWKGNIIRTALYGEEAA